jgi:hypothetical protein
VDFGRRDIAVTSTGKSWSGKHIQEKRDKYSRDCRYCSLAHPIVTANVSSNSWYSSCFSLSRKFLLLNSLRGFRHFFRHAYGVPIDYEQLQINLNKARQLYPCLERELNQFFEALQ